MTADAAAAGRAKVLCWITYGYPTAYLAHEILEKERAVELWQRIITHEASSLVVLQAGSTVP